VSNWPEVARARLEYFLRNLHTLSDGSQRHRYLSSACLHWVHADCAGGCEHCAGPCVCSCHRPPTAEEGQGG
jgi:hypothetical protein